MYLYARGSDSNFQLGIAPTTKDKKGCVDSLNRVPFDLKGVQCVSTGVKHSVIIKYFRVFAAGDDTDFKIGSSNPQIYTTFTEIKISEEPISWAECGFNFTLYLTTNRKLILCHKKAKGARIQVPIANIAVSVFAGYGYGGIIDNAKSINIIDKDDPYKPLQRFSFDSSPVDLVCCCKYMCVLTADGRVFANGRLNKDSQDFAEVPSLKGKKIEKISGFDATCAALTSDGRVFICGSNYSGQSFTEVRINEAIKDISCSQHTLFLTKTNKNRWMRIQ